MRKKIVLPFMIVISALGLSMIWDYLPQLLKQYESRGYLKTEGVITESRLVRYSSRGYASSSSVIRFNYEVNGVPFQAAQRRYSINGRPVLTAQCRYTMGFLSRIIFPRGDLVKMFPASNTNPITG